MEKMQQGRYSGKGKENSMIYGIIQHWRFPYLSTLHPHNKGRKKDHTSTPMPSIPQVQPGMLIWAKSGPVKYKTAHASVPHLPTLGVSISRKSIYFWSLVCSNRTWPVRCKIQRLSGTKCHTKRLGAWAPGRLALDVAQTFGTAVKLVLLALNNLSASQGAAFTEINGFGPNFSECVSSWLIKCEDST